MGPKAVPQVGPIFAPSLFSSEVWLKMGLLRVVTWKARHFVSQTCWASAKTSCLCSAAYCAHAWFGNRMTLRVWAMVSLCWLVAFSRKLGIHRLPPAGQDLEARQLGKKHLLHIFNFLQFLGTIFGASIGAESWPTLKKALRTMPQKWVQNVAPKVGPPISSENLIRS